MPIHDGQKLVIFDVSESLAKMGFAQESEMGKQLPEPNVG